LSLSKPVQMEMKAGTKILLLSEFGIKSCVKVGGDLFSQYVARQSARDTGCPKKQISRPHASNCGLHGPPAHFRQK
jgi:hypothetical protein